MGSISAMSSINRVLDRHHQDITNRMMAETKSRLVTGVLLENDVYEIATTWCLNDGTQLRGPSLDIDQLASDYPDCEVGY